MKKSTSFDPIWAPILTHYSSQKELELDSNLIEKHIKWLEPNVKQFLICGTTGDGWNLNDKLIKDWLNITIKKIFLINRIKSYLVSLETILMTS